MTPFPDLPDAEKIAAMRERAKTEAEQYGQTTVPAMLLQGAAWGERVAELEAKLRRGIEWCDLMDGPVSKSQFCNGQATAAQQIRAALEGQR